MGTDTGTNLMDPGDTPAQNASFLFFCTAVIQAVNKHQGLLRASVANIGQDHRLGANEAPPAIISVFLGAELDKAFESIVAGKGDGVTEDATLGLGTPVLPPLPLHGGDRNRTSPFAFTGNKFEFRALGSSMSLAFPNTVLNTIVAEAIDDLAGNLEAKIASGEEIGAAVTAVVKESYSANKAVCFGGDNYSDEWHAEAEQRGLKNLRTTPDALPEVVADDTVAAFEKYNVLSKRELEARFEVWVEQYAALANIEAETARTIAKTMLLPAAIRYAIEVDAAGVGGISSELEPLINQLVERIGELEQANLYPDGIEGLELAEYARDKQLAKMAEVREVADALELIVADDLWPLPKYSEILFIK
jgi:glutamine synthetase